MKISTKVLAAAGAAVLFSAAAPVASAVEYPPVNPTSVRGVCNGDIPYYEYSVDYGENGKYVGDPLTITFVNPNGSSSVINTTVPAPGQTVRALWPGASESPQDWPGWVQDANGQWVESTSDLGAYTRAPGGVKVDFATNPTLSSTAIYPPAGSQCANPKNVKPASTPLTPTSNPAGPAVAGGANVTPVTGANLLPVAAGAAALAAGGGLIWASRRRRES